MAGMVPIPGSDIRKWAQLLVEYLQRDAPIAEANTPRPVLLARKDENSRATQDGILLYDPVNEEVVVSERGLWQPLTRGRRGFGSMRIVSARAGADITAAWQRIAPFNDEPTAAQGCSFDLADGTITVLRPGVWRFSCAFSFVANNSGAVREIELRYVNAGTGVPTGAPFAGENAGRIMNIGFTALYDLTDLIGIPIATEIRASVGTFSTVSWAAQNVAIDFSGPSPVTP